MFENVYFHRLDTPPRVRAHTAQGDITTALVWFILKINTEVLSQISSVHSVKRRWTCMIELIVLLKGKKPIHIYHIQYITAVLTNQRQLLWLVFSAHLKGIVHLKNKNSALNYSPLCYSKPVVCLFVFFNHGTQEVLSENYNRIIILGWTMDYDFK